MKKFLTTVLAVLCMAAGVYGNGSTAVPAGSPQLTGIVIVGGVTHNKARFRAALSEAGQFHIELSTSQQFSGIISTNTAVCNTASYLRGIVEVEGLQANTKYYYRVKINGSIADTITRSFMTYPVPGSEMNFTFAFGSCLNSGNFLPSGTPPGNIFREVVKHQPRFFLQIGDYGYPDTTDNLPFFPNFFAGNMALVQQSYVTKFDRNYLIDTLLVRTPIDYIYDDHDYMNDNGGATTSSFFVPFKPNPLGNDFVTIEFPNPVGARENSITGYRDNFPSYPLVNESRGIYHKFTFGNAEIFVPDLRSQRSPNLNSVIKNTTTGFWEFNPPAGHSILGRNNAPGTGQSQFDWLLQSLENSTATWKFIASSVPLNIGQKAGIQLGITLQDSILNIPEFPAGTRGIFAAMELADKWVGFPEDVDSLIRFVQQRQIKNVIVLSGDSHTAAIDDGANAGFPEIMAGGLDITNSKLVALLENFGVHIWNKGGQGLSTQLFNNAFGKIDVFGADSVRLSLVDEEGTVFAKHTVTNSEPIPVELTSFTAIAEAGQVTLRWSTATEKNNKEFGIERSVDGKVFSSIGFTAGNGTTTELREYRFTDNNPAAGISYYRLKQTDYDGSFEYSHVIQVSAKPVLSFTLEQNHPNPFNPETQISFTLPEKGFVTLAVYNILGKEVDVLFSGELESGRHTVNFNAKNYSSGVYIYKLTGGGAAITRKMILTK